MCIVSGTHQDQSSSALPSRETNRVRTRLVPGSNFRPEDTTRPTDLCTGCVRGSWRIHTRFHQGRDRPTACTVELCSSSPIVDHIRHDHNYTRSHETSVNLSSLWLRGHFRVCGECQWANYMLAVHVGHGGEGSSERGCVQQPRGIGYNCGGSPYKRRVRRHYVVVVQVRTISGGHGQRHTLQRVLVVFVWCWKRL